MKLKFLLSALSFVAVLQTTTAQNVGINSTGTAPDNSAMLDVSASNKGLLIPRINLTSTTDNTTIPNPAAGLLIYNTNAAIGNGVGYYSNTTNSVSPSWVKLVTSNGKPWETSGNTGTTAGTDFIGTTDGQDLVFKRNGSEIARITPDGIGIGSSSPTVALGAAVPTSTNGYLHFGQAANISSTSGIDLMIDNDNSSSSTNFRVRKDGGTTLMQVQEDGALGLGTTNPDGSAILDVKSTNRGVLLPRIALTGTADATTITSPTTSLLVYNTATAGTAPNNVIPGYYYWNGTAWVRFVTEDKFNINFTNGGGTSLLNNGNYHFISATGLLRSTGQALTPNMSGTGPVNDVFLFTATSTCVLSKLNISFASALLSRTFVFDVYKYTPAANSAVLPSGTALITSTSVTSSATAFANSFATANGNATVLQAGDVVCVMVKNGHNATGNFYISGSLEFISK